MRAIDISHKDKVYLLPKTVDYYQEELTTMLETERFSEAIQTLDFLLECQSDDPETAAEWRRLLDWLQTSFGSGQAESAHQEEDEDITEEDLHNQRFYAMMAEDPGYVKKLLETVLNNPNLENKMIAIEQLIVAEHPQIDETLRRWIEQVDLHPLVQYKVLQALRARGTTGIVELERGGERVSVDIADTPLDLIQCAEPIQSVIERVKAVSEVDHPSLAYFADHTWKEFLAYSYGTSLYQQLSIMGMEEAEEWAAALHSAVVESMTGNVSKEEIFELYKINQQNEHRYEQHREQLFSFIHHTFMP